MLSPLYGQLSPLRIPTKAGRFISVDADVSAYILAVEAADGQELEAGVITAVESFILGCKADGIWSALKASCILAGARTLDGALVPLVGTAPTNFNFVSGDYDRETGLKGQDSVVKYLNSNRASTDDPLDSFHLSCYVTEIPSFTWIRGYIGQGARLSDGPSGISSNTTQSITMRCRAAYNTGQVVNSAASSTGLKSISRGSSSSYIARVTGSSQVFNATSTSGATGNIRIFSNDFQQRNFDGRLSFYSIGESLDLADLDTRVSTLMTDIAAAIP